jgi:Sensors of blue-light using FAD
MSTENKTLLDAAAAAARPASAAHQYLYLSQLVDRYQYDVYAAICHVARARNEAARLVGYLLFDGHRFCQLIEGPTAAAQTLMDSIARDRRHTALEMLVDRPRSAPSAMTRWVPGFCAPDELDVFEGPQGLRGDDALAAFLDLVWRADLSP